MFQAHYQCSSGSVGHQMQQTYVKMFDFSWLVHKASFRWKNIKNGELFSRIVGSWLPQEQVLSLKTFWRFLLIFRDLARTASLEGIVTAVWRIGRRWFAEIDGFFIAFVYIDFGTRRYMTATNDLLIYFHKNDDNSSHKVYLQFDRARMYFF